MSKSDEIAQLIPLYRQFIAERRASAQKQADRLKGKPTERAAVGSEAAVAGTATVPGPDQPAGEEGSERDK